MPSGSSSWGPRSSAALKAENLFLRKQLALYLSELTAIDFCGAQPTDDFRRVLQHGSPKRSGVSRIHSQMPAEKAGLMQRADLEVQDGHLSLVIVFGAGLLDSRLRLIQLSLAQFND
jgi:hypothetical protein